MKSQIISLYFDLCYIWIILPVIKFLWTYNCYRALCSQPRPVPFHLYQAVDLHFHLAAGRVAVAALVLQVNSVSSFSVVLTIRAL